eukprot:104033-Amphidinium_carterae.1
MGDIIWTVKLPIDFCDDHDYAVEDISQMVLWPKGASQTFSFHGNTIGSDRRAVEVNLYRMVEEPPSPEDAFTLEFRMPNVAVEAANADPTNPYICAAFDVTQLGTDLPAPTDPDGMYHVA